ncbi:MAG: DNA polymerase IV, partial [Kiritimatiellae bacterium]|nr:DNA polymerase IV [Kiritimatiellia bacterium]
MQTILHVDMDAFFASVEQRDHPEWRGKPVIVGADPHQRGVVSTCSYEARKFGVHSAMPSREAYRRCPQGIFVPGRMSRYREASDQVFAIFERFSPVIEPVSIDEAFIDVSGAMRLFGDAVSIARQIRQAIREEVHLTASIGVATNKFLAKLGSEAAKPDGLFVVPEEETARLAWLGKLPIGTLWGVGKTLEATLLRYGYRTVEEIRNAPPATLRKILGDHAAESLLALSRGEDHRQVE